MYSEGKTPSSTPPTRTRNGFYRVPYAADSISYGDESWPVINGTVECPLEIGFEQHGWPAATPDEAAAYTKARAGLDKEADAKRKAEEKAAADAKKAEDKAAAEAKKAEEKAAAETKKAEDKAAADAKKAEEEAAAATAKKATDDAAAAAAATTAVVVEPPKQ